MKAQATGDLGADVAVEAVGDRRPEGRPYADPVKLARANGPQSRVLATA